MRSRQTPAKAGNADTGADGHEKEKNMWEICKDLQDEIVAMRRDLHQIPERGRPAGDQGIHNEEADRNGDPIY